MRFSGMVQDLFDTCSGMWKRGKVSKGSGYLSAGNWTSLQVSTVYGGFLDTQLTCQHWELLNSGKTNALPDPDRQLTLLFICMGANHADDTQPALNSPWDNGLCFKVLRIFLFCYIFGQHKYHRGTQMKTDQNESCLSPETLKTIKISSK